MSPTPARATARRSKYGAVPTVVDGIRFASKAEAKRWKELLLLERAGQITRLRRQPRFDLVVRNEKVGTYVGDFGYGTSACDVIEDVKGVATPVFKLKWAICRLLYPSISWRIVRVRA